jgi:hypothetical protein
MTATHLAASTGNTMLLKCLLLNGASHPYVRQRLPCLLSLSFAREVLGDVRPGRARGAPGRARGAGAVGRAVARQGGARNSEICCVVLFEKGLYNAAGGAKLVMTL